MKGFEERLSKLEDITEKIQSGDLPLEQAVDYFEQGVTLARSLEKDLSKIERKIEILTNKPETPQDTPELELFPELSDGTEEE